MVYAGTWDIVGTPGLMLFFGAPAVTPTIRSEMGVDQVLGGFFAPLNVEPTWIARGGNCVAGNIDIGIAGLGLFMQITRIGLLTERRFCIPMSVFCMPCGNRTAPVANRITAARNDRAAGPPADIGLHRRRRDGKSRSGQEKRDGQDKTDQYADSETEFHAAPLLPWFSRTRWCLNSDGTRKSISRLARDDLTDDRPRDTVPK
jgi:hypothetical protein